MSVGLIMAGGLGKRLWPESSVTHPKHLLNLVGRESFLQAAYRRASHLFGRENTFLVIREELREAVVSQLPELPFDNIIAEPQGKDTAPCIGFASVWVRRRKGDDSMVVLPADHIIRDEERFAEIISAAARQAKKGLLVTIGIKPTRAETGYGYLEIGNKLGDLDGIPLFEVKRFTEKPSHKKAKEFFEQGSFLWNAGIFAWTPNTILEQMELHLPELYQGLIRIEEALGTKDEQRVIREVYPSLPKISIDYGIMEKVSSVVAVPGDFFWDDIGDWKALERVLSKDKAGNIIRGLVEERESSNCILINRENKILGAIGLSDVIIINTEKGILVVRKEEAQKVKELVNELLKDEKLKKYLQ